VARTKGSSIAKEMRGNLTAEAERKKAQVDAQIAEKLAEAKARIAQSKAMASVGEIAADTAGAIVARLIGKEVSKDEVQRALVQRAAE
jgi:F-type H+-transporting ATPase subunit b